MPETIALGDIRTDGGTQARETLDMLVINEYAEAMRRGDTFPPIDVYFDDTTYWLADGFHRVQAARQTQQRTIPATVHQGGKREALLHAVGANDAHGLRRSNADKRKAVTTLLSDEEWRQWSDSEIARRTRTSQPFVTKIRGEYLQTFEDSTATRKVRRGGTTYTMQTSRIGGKPVEKPTGNATAPTRREATERKSATVAPRPVQPVPPSRSPATSKTPAPSEPTPPPAATPAKPAAAPTPQPPSRATNLPEAKPDVSTPYLALVWEQASVAEREAFVEIYRPTLLDMLGVKTSAAATVSKPGGTPPDSQPGIILGALGIAEKPLSQEELSRVWGINVRVLGRNLTRLLNAGRIEETSDGRYAVAPTQ